MKLHFNQMVDGEDCWPTCVFSSVRNVSSGHPSSLIEAIVCVRWRCVDGGDGPYSVKLSDGACVTTDHVLTVDSVPFYSRQKKKDHPPCVKWWFIWPCNHMPVAYYSLQTITIISPTGVLCWIQCLVFISFRCSQSLSPENEYQDGIHFPRVRGENQSTGSKYIIEKQAGHIWCFVWRVERLQSIGHGRGITLYVVNQYQTRGDSFKRNLYRPRGTYIYIHTTVRWFSRLTSCFCLVSSKTPMKLFTLSPRGHLPQRDFKTSRPAFSRPIVNSHFGYGWNPIVTMTRKPKQNKSRKKTKERF